MDVHKHCLRWCHLLALNAPGLRPKSVLDSTQTCFSFQIPPRYSRHPLRPPTKKTDGKSAISLRLKGDGSDFQFRVKASTRDRHSYIYNFKTSGDWETISIPLSDMSPSFRGNSLQIPNFNHNKIEQIGVLKSSKESKTFKLEIKHIYMVN